MPQCRTVRARYLGWFRQRVSWSKAMLKKHLKILTRIASFQTAHKSAGDVSLQLISRHIRVSSTYVTTYTCHFNLYHDIYVSLQLISRHIRVTSIYVTTYKCHFNLYHDIYVSLQLIPRHISVTSIYVTTYTCHFNLYHDIYVSLQLISRHIPITSTYITTYTYHFNLYITIYTYHFNLYRDIYVSLRGRCSDSLRAGRSGDGIPVRGEIFRTRPNRLWDPSSLLYIVYEVSFPGVKHPGRGVNHSPHLAPRLKKE
jgi:hypothetical protein